MGFWPSRKADGRSLRPRSVGGNFQGIYSGLTRATNSSQHKADPKKLRVPRWCKVHSSRPVARVRPSLDLLSSLPLRASTRDLHSGSGLTANRTNLLHASELYPAFDFSPRSPRPALSYRPLLALLRLHLAMPKVTALEPRTLHQPEKLQKLSKNDSVFTLFKNRVNQKDARITPTHFQASAAGSQADARKWCSGDIGFSRTKAVDAEFSHEQRVV